MKYNFLILIFLFSIFSAFSSEENITISAKSVSDLIYIEKNAEINEILPFHEYSFPLVINLNISSEYLKNINSKNITLFVKAVVKDEKFIYFEGRRNTTYVVLTCFLEEINKNEFRCNSSSILSKEIRVYLYSNKTDEEINSTIIFSASFKPFEEFIPIYEESIKLQKELDEIKKSANLSNPEIDKKIKEAQLSIDNFHVAEAKEEIKDLNIMIGNPVIILSSFFAQLHASISSFLDFLSPDSKYLIPIFLSLILISAALLLKLRKGSKYGILLVSTLIIILSIFNLVDFLLLVLADLILVLFILSILYARKERGNVKFRANDRYNDNDYENILRKRNY